MDTSSLSLQELIDSVSLSDRKWRLFACACCREIWDLLTDPRSRRAVEVAEQFADGLISEKEMNAARAAAWDAARAAARDAAWDAARAAAWAAARAAARDAAWVAARAAAWVAARAAQKQLLADISGYGCEDSISSIDASWRTQTTMAIAKSMYDSRDFSDMPILADALQEAGCDDAAIIEHCQSKMEHVKGCWVVDLVLERK